MTDELELRLARLAGNLVRDLDEVDALTFGKGREQKVQLAREALDEALRYAANQPEPPTCTVPFCKVDHAVPASLIDHGC